MSRTIAVARDVDVGVNLGRPEVGVSEQLLDGAEIRTV
jgi:hypothetical protein